MTAQNWYISDLDGTLLGSDGRLSAESVRLLNQMLADGLHFTVASARSLQAIQRILQGVHLHLPIIEQNGTFLTDPLTGEHLMENTLDNALACTLLEDMLAYGIAPALNTWQDGARMYHTPANNPAIREFVAIRQRVHDPRLRFCPTPAALAAPAAQQRVICYTLLDEEEKIFTLHRRWLNAYAGKVSLILYRDILVPGYRQLSVYAAEATKAHALDEFARFAGFSPAQATVFGDDVNDLEMFAWAGRAVAMGNAIADVKSAAHTVAGPNYESAVARFIHKEFYK